MKKHRRVRVKCSCGSGVEMSGIQFDDFDCGMMGFLNCPKCGTVLLPGHHRKDERVEVETFEAEGEDRGWT